MLLRARHITNLTDARYFAAKAFAFLGFNLEEGTEGYLDPTHMKAIMAWVEGPGILGEFPDASPEYIREAAAFFGLDGVVISAGRAAGILPGLTGLTVWLEFDIPFDPVAWNAVLESASGRAAYFVLPVTSREFRGHLPYLQSVCSRYPVILHPEMPVSDIPALLDSLRPAGLSLSGGAEEKVGIKSFDELETLFETLGIS